MIFFRYFFFSFFFQINTHIVDGVCMVKLFFYATLIFNNALVSLAFFIQRHFLFLYSLFFFSFFFLMPSSRNLDNLLIMLNFYYLAPFSISKPKYRQLHIKTPKCLFIYPFLSYLHFCLLDRMFQSPSPSYSILFYSFHFLC